MDSGTHWNLFYQTGRIADYLRYREALRAETARESDPTEETHATEDRRRGDPREGDGRE
jgi:hypothetical protein